MIVEGLVSLLVLWGCRESVRRGAVAAWAMTLFAANLTHPVLWLVVGPGSSVPVVLAAEGIIALVETMVWRTFTARTASPWLIALAVGLGCNAVSFAAGLIAFAG